MISQRTTLATHILAASRCPGSCQAVHLRVGSHLQPAVTCVLLLVLRRLLCRKRRSLHRGSGPALSLGIHRIPQQSTLCSLGAAQVSVPSRVPNIPVPSCSYASHVLG